MKKINALTGLRFLFIITIVFSHLTLLKTHLPNSFSLFSNGQLGVIFFFMISGFGLTFKKQTAQNNPLFEDKITIKSSVTFAIKRISKIYLLFVITTLLTVPTSIHQVITNNPRDSIFLSLGKILCKLLVTFPLLQSLTGSNTFIMTFNISTWFLSTIFILYVFYPLLEKFNDKIMKKNPYMWLIIVSIMREAVKFLFRLISTKVAFLSMLEYVSPFTRIFDFVQGIIVCDVFLSITKEKNTNKKLGNLFEPIVFLLVIFSWIFLPSLTQNAFVLSISYCLTIMLTIFIFAFESGFLSKLFSCKFFVTMGNCSMYVFLIHYCILLNAELIFENTIGSSLLSDILTVATTVVLTAVWVLIIQLVNKKKKASLKEAFTEPKTETDVTTKENSENQVQ